MFINKNSDTLEIADHSLLNSPIVIPRYGFHFRSTDLADKPHSYDSGSICKQTWFSLIHYSAFFGSEGHVALDRNPGTGYDTVLLRMIPGDLLSAFPHRQFHTLPGLLDSWAALPNSNPNALRAMQGDSLYHFMMVFGMTRPRGELTTYRASGEHATD